MLCFLSGLVLAACQENASTKLAQSIQQDIQRQGGTSLKSVACPKKLEPEAEDKPVECVGETDAGYSFTIAVKLDEQGNPTTWEVPQAKGLVNLKQLETQIQDTLKAELEGGRATVNCGGVYKPAKPGESFECKLDIKAPEPKSKAGSKPAAKDAANVPTNKPTQADQTKKDPKKPAQPEKIVVNIDADGNITWQRLLPGQIARKPGDPSPTPSPAPTASPVAGTTNQPNAGASPAASPADGAAPPPTSSPTANPSPGQNLADQLPDKTYD
jgi:hypothetical protein